jgi:hypothetical protein
VSNPRCVSSLFSLVFCVIFPRSRIRHRAVPVHLFSAAPAEPLWNLAPTSISAHTISPSLSFYPLSFHLPVLDNAIIFAVTLLGTVILRSGSRRGLRVRTRLDETRKTEEVMTRYFITTRGHARGPSFNKTSCPSPRDEDTCERSMSESESYIRAVLLYTCEGP